MLRKYILLILILLSFESVQAITFSAVIGVGSSTTTNEISEPEGPLSQAYTLEKYLNSRSVIGMEHVRSLNTKLTTSIALTGVLWRFYINSAPTQYYAVDSLPTSLISYRDYSFYLGSGVGFAQSSRLPNPEGLSSNAAGVYISPRAGVDYQLTQTVGLRSELLIGMTLLGKGSISIFSLGGGVFWNF